jgi:hypothetical protein
MGSEIYYGGIHMGDANWKSMVLFFWWNKIKPCCAKLEWNVERIVML